MAHLKLNNLSMIFGGIKAMHDLNFSIEEGEILGIIGPNGAGKTTLFNCLTGVYVPSEGEIVFHDNDGQTVSFKNKRMDEITKLGFARTFQNIRLFDQSTLLDNIKIGMNQKGNYNFIDALLRTSRYYDTEEEFNKEALRYLEIVSLGDRAEDLAGNLSYGDQRRLEIVRAIATGAKYLFLDEPAAGMNGTETLELKSLIRTIHEHFNLTIVLIEHDMGLVMDVCDRLLVLNFGKQIALDVPSAVQKDEVVIKAYLGEAS